MTNDKLIQISNKLFLIGLHLDELSDEIEGLKYEIDEVSNNVKQTSTEKTS